MPKLAANLSMLFTEVDFLDRFEAAAKAGFRGVEYLFPYDIPVEVIAEKLKACDLEQVLFNLPAGDWGAGDRGIACDPARVEEFKAGVDQAIAYARVLGNTQVNCLTGIVPEGVTPAEAEATVVANLKFAAEKLEQAGICLIVEAINTRDIPGFFLTSTKQALKIKELVASDNLLLQYDIYHMQIMEGDLGVTTETNIDVIQHVQLADNPGRHEPGTGEINYHFMFQHLERIGYKGWIGCEYKPATTTEEGLSWLKDYNLI